MISAVRPARYRLYRRIAVCALVTAVLLVGSAVPAVSAPITLPDDKPLELRGGWILREGSAGHKVKAVQEAMGYPSSAWEVYDQAMAARVKSAQRAAGLRRTGRVNKATWQAIGVNGRWRMDAFNQRPRTTPDSSRRDRINVMIETARSYLGSEYVWGGSGNPRRGVDCSGLVLQAMYSAGLHPTGVSLRRHQTTDYVTTDAMLSDPGLRQVPFDRVRRGDLVFFVSSASGRVNHVALAVSRGRVVEAVEPTVREAAIDGRSSQRPYAMAIRPFPKHVRSR